MKNLCLLLVLFSVACLNPVSVEVGMSYESFAEMCAVERNHPFTNSMSNTQGTFFTIELDNSGERKDRQLDMKGCVGKFTFLNNKLDTIH